MVGAATLPTYSVLGRPVEPFCMCGALLLGEMVGFTLETHWRSAFLELCDREAKAEQLSAEILNQISSSYMPSARVAALDAASK